MIEHKDFEIEIVYEITILTDNLHYTFKFNNDFEIRSYKKLFKYL